MGKRQEPPIDRAEVRKRLDRATADGNLVRVRRWIPGADVIEGFVLTRTKTWVLLAKLSAQIDLDGWAAIRTKDIQAVTIYPAEDCFEIKVLQARAQWPTTIPAGLDLSTAADILSSASDTYPMVTVHREFERPDVCWIGAVRRLEAETLSLLEVNVGGGWARKPRRFDVEDISRVEFGGGYEDALLLVSGPAPRPANKRAK